MASGRPGPSSLGWEGEGFGFGFGVLGLGFRYIGIMEKKKETTI